MALRAVIFDYGMVLSGPQDPASYNALLQLTGLPRDRFEPLYWADRHAYDEGKLTGLAFWQKFLHDAGLPERPETIAELNRWDAQMWTTENSAMVAWQKQLKERGLKTAILSNMGDHVQASVEQAFAWMRRFDLLVWSHQLGFAKPDPAIYRHTLGQLGVAAGESLFLDDRPDNIEAAQSLGMRAIQFSTAEKLRADLIAAGMNAELPLPEPGQELK